MKKNMILACALIATGVGAVGMSAALADNHDSKNETAETQLLMNAKIGAVQAARAADNKAGGKAASVSFEGSENGKPFYAVEILTPDGKRQDVSVDAASGEVTKIAVAQEDENSGQNADESGEGSESGENAPQ